MRFALSRLTFASITALLLIYCCISPASAEGKRWALLIGIDKYKCQDIEPLNYAVADAKEVADELVSALGYDGDNVFTMTDLSDKEDNRPTRINIITRLALLAKKIGPDDSLLIYFAGHGFQRGEGENSKNFLGTSDTFNDSLPVLKSSSLPFEDLQELITDIKARQIVFIIDACRNKMEHSRGDSENKRTSDFTRRLTVTLEASDAGKKKGTAILFACSENESSHEDVKFQHGVFTHFLLEGMRGGARVSDNQLMIDDLAVYIQARMEAFCADHSYRQRPDLHVADSARIALGVMKEPGQSALAAELTVATNPPGARIYLDGKEIPDAKTPQTIKVNLGREAKKRMRLNLHLDGYKDANLEIEPVAGKRKEIPIVELRPVSDGHPPLHPRPGDTWRNPIDGAEMAFIPSGHFQMGDEGWDNTPLHQVSLDGFWICKTPTTVAQYRKFCDATNHPMPPSPAFNQDWMNPDHPIVNVSWEDAKAYCEWAGCLLPTEAQWEFAARGAEERPFPWGKTFANSRLWCSKKQKEDAGGTKPVGLFPDGASPYGLLDMEGNVKQWCNDYYTPDFYKTARGQKPNPENTQSESMRVFRGGSWQDFEVDEFRCALRHAATPKYARDFIGFRCALPAAPY